MSLKFRNISVLASFVCLWLSSYLTAELELFLGFFLILSFGLLHGANDIVLFDKVSKFQSKLPYLLILGIYVSIVLLILMLFHWLPMVALGLFVLCSAYHFGEQHWTHKVIDTGATIKNFFYVGYGLFIISLLLLLNSTEVMGIVEAIIHQPLPALALSILFYAVSSVFIVLSAYLLITDPDFRDGAILELVYLLVFAVIFKVSSLIWGFAIYFIFWHSLPSLYDQVTFMYQGFYKATVLAYVKKALPYWLISIVGLLGLYYLFKDLTIFNALFFSFLAAVTLPHSLLIHTMFQRKDGAVKEQ